MAYSALLEGFCKLADFGETIKSAMKTIYYSNIIEF